MNIQLADQLGRELAWLHCRSLGIVDDKMVKQAGILEGILFAPLSGIAALLSAPFGSKMRSMGMGLLMGAGVGALSQRELENRNRAGEPVTEKELSPAMKAIMAGLAVGGTQRVQDSMRTGKPMSGLGAMLTGAPLGALLASDPSKGFVLGGISGHLLAAFGQGKGENPLAKLLPQGITGQPAIPPEAAQPMQQAPIPAGMKFPAAMQSAMGGSQPTQEQRPGAIAMQDAVKVMQSRASQRPIQAPQQAMPIRGFAPPMAAQQLLR